RSGRFDIFLHSNLQPWDLAAGLLLVREAGGIVTERDGSEPTIFSEAVVAASPGVHADFLSLAGSRPWRWLRVLPATSGRPVLVPCGLPPGPMAGGACANRPALGRFRHRRGVYSRRALCRSRTDPQHPARHRSDPPLARLLHHDGHPAARPSQHRSPSEKARSADLRLKPLI